MAAADARIAAREAGIDLAEEQYKPGWAIDLNYGLRDGQLPNGDPRSDFFSAILHRLRFICGAKSMGFTLSDVKLILYDVDAGEAPCAKMRRLVRARSEENNRRLTEALRLQRRIRKALAAWEAVPEHSLDHESRCRLIDAVALEAAQDDPQPQA